MPPPVPPKIEPFSFQDGLRENMMTRLVCGVSQGDLPIQFTWYKDDKELRKDDPWTNHIEISTLDPYSTLLRFSSLSADHAGTYICLASNRASQTYFSAKLEVQGKEKHDKSVSLNNSKKIICFLFSLLSSQSYFSLLFTYNESFLYTLLFFAFI